MTDIEPGTLIDVAVDGHATTHVAAVVRMDELTITIRFVDSGIETSIPWTFLQNIEWYADDAQRDAALDRVAAQ